MQLNTKCNNLDPAECRYNMEPEKQTFSPGNPEILLVRWPSGPGPTGGIYHLENSRKYYILVSCCGLSAYPRISSMKLEESWNNSLEIRLNKFQTTNLDTPLAQSSWKKISNVHLYASNPVIMRIRMPCQRKNTHCCNRSQIFPNHV